MDARIQTLHDGDTFAHDGLRFVVSIEHDHDHGAPWENEDCHGPVSEWTRRDKKPGEWVLCSDRGSKRFYDAAEATRIARRDGWGLAENGIAALAAKLGRTPTQGEITAEVVRQGFEFLRRWCNDDWHYVGVCVRHVTQNEDARYGHASWGIESDCTEYIAEVARELAAECAATIRAEIEAQREALVPPCAPLSAPPCGSS